MKMPTEKQISYLAALCARRGFQTPDLNGLSSFIVSRMIDCAVREFDPACIDPATGDELLAKSGAFEAWHKNATMPRAMNNLQIVNTETGEIHTKGVTFHNAHRMAAAFDAAARNGLPMTFKESFMVGCGAALTHTSQTIQFTPTKG